MNLALYYKPVAIPEALRYDPCVTAVLHRHRC